MKCIFSILKASVLFFLLATPLTHSQSDPLEDPENSILPFTANPTLQHTTLVVSDFSVSKPFYTELLGFRQIDAPWLPKNQMFVALGENLELHVGEVPGVKIVPSTFNHFAFSVANLDAFLEYLKANDIVYSSLGGDVKYEVYTRPDGVRQTFFQDPDGYWIEVNDFQKR